MNQSHNKARRFIDELVQRGYLNASLDETLAIAKVLDELMGWTVERALDDDQTLRSIVGRIPDEVENFCEEAKKMTDSFPSKETGHFSKCPYGNEACPKCKTITPEPVFIDEVEHDEENCELCNHK